MQLRIKEDEKAMMSTTEAQQHVLSIPGMGPILASVVVSEIDDIGRFNSAQKLCGYIGLCPSTSGGKTYNGKLMRHCNKWLRWAFVEAAWVAMGCDSYFGDLYKRKRALGKKANTAILCVARRMARITWQLLTQKRSYETTPPPHPIQGRPAKGAEAPAGSVKEGEGKTSSASAEKGKRQSQTKQTFPSRSNCTLVGC